MKTPKFRLKREGSQKNWYVFWSEGSRTKRRSTGSQDQSEAQKFLDAFIRDRAGDPEAPATFVYFIGEPGDALVKIGISDNPSGRCATLRTGNHKKLTVLKTLKFYNRTDAHDTEQALHAVLKNRRVGGEWFDLSTSPMSHSAIPTNSETR